MKSAEEGAGCRPDTATLQAVLTRRLRTRYGPHRSIAALTRAPSPYRSSSALEDLDVQLDDGTELSLVFKDLGWDALSADARRSKPSFLYQPRREIGVYRALLTDAPPGTAICYGTVSDLRRRRYWLFLERVPGGPLYEIGDFTIWKAAARWLASMHARFAQDAEALSAMRGVRLIRHDAASYRRWLRRARPALLHAAQALPAHDATRIRRLVTNYEAVIAQFVALPVTLLHGEFYASNVLVQIMATGHRICPVDWEMAAIGPAMVDLAALIAGFWTEDQKAALAQAYYDTALAVGGNVPSPTAFQHALACCRLHIAVQWLGWSSEWEPPPEHAYDWVGEALQLVDMLGV